MTSVVLAPDTWSAVLATTRRTRARAESIAALMPASGTLKLYSGASATSLSGATLIRTITVGAWSVGDLQADGRYPLVPGTFTDAGTGSGTPNWAVFSDNLGTEVFRCPAGVGEGVFQLSAPLSGGAPITRGSFVLLLATDDVPVTPPSGSAWIDVALSDMRRPGWAGSYLGSYSANDDVLWGRSAVSYSSQSERAQLSMGRYASPTAFTSTNPDYFELGWISDPAVLNATWGRLIFWNQVYLSNTYRDSHLPGFVNNTRVVSFNHQVWIKRKSTGTWDQIVFQPMNLGGEAWSATFRVAGDSGDFDIRTETFGFRSVRPVMDATAPNVPYWVPHGYIGLVGINGADIAEVISTQAAALTLHDPSGADDRDYARFLLACGADYYPTTGSLSVYPGVGTSRHKFVTAKWPNYQWHVMHTMTEAQFDPPAQLRNLT